MIKTMEQVFPEFAASVVLVDVNVYDQKKGIPNKTVSSSDPKIHYL